MCVANGRATAEKLTGRDGGRCGGGRAGKAGIVTGLQLHVDGLVESALDKPVERTIVHAAKRIGRQNHIRAFQASGILLNVGVLLVVVPVRPRHLGRQNCSSGTIRALKRSHKPPAGFVELEKIDRHTGVTIFVERFAR